MATRKNNSASMDEERTSASGELASDTSRISDEDALDTRAVSHSAEEGDEDFDDEDDELTEDDFAVDELDDDDTDEDL